MAGCKIQECKKKARRHVIGMNDNLGDGVREGGSETWKGCE